MPTLKIYWQNINICNMIRTNKDFNFHLLVACNKCAVSHISNFTTFSVDLLN